MPTLKTFHTIVNEAIARAVAKGIHNNERVLLLLTETKPFSGYGYDALYESEPHTTDGKLILPFGKNEQGQRQYLISFDPSSCDDKTHPDPNVPVGWDWEIYKPLQAKQPELEQAKMPQIIIVLTRPKQTELDSLAADSGKGDTTGFSLVKMPDLEKFEQFAIIVDPSVFTVQVRTT